MAFVLSHFDHDGRFVEILHQQALNMAAYLRQCQAAYPHQSQCGDLNEAAAVHTAAALRAGSTDAGSSRKHTGRKLRVAADGNHKDVVGADNVIHRRRCLPGRRNGDGFQLDNGALSVGAIGFLFTRLGQGRRCCLAGDFLHGSGNQIPVPRTPHRQQYGNDQNHDH